MPFGLALLLLSRRAIMAHTPTMLSRSTKFLWADYEPAWCFWEVIELLRKIALTGFVLLIPNSTIMKRTLVGLGIRRRALLRSEQALACHAGTSG